LLPESLLLHAISADRIVARYLERDDLSWVEALLEEHRRRAGMPRRLLRERLVGALPGAPPECLRLALRVLEDLCVDEDEVVSLIRPRIARREVFAERARSGASREEVVAAVAMRLGVGAGELEDSLMADMKSERRVGRLPPDFGAWDLVLRINLALAQGFVARAGSATIDLEGNARRVVRQATWQGLLCTVRAADSYRGRIEVSGPLSILRPTRMYGRALASIVPMLPWCRRYRLEARCLLGGRELSFRLDDSDEIAAGAEPRRHDSSLEEAFEADLARVAPEWDVLREPEALPVGDTLIFPDFAIWRRVEPGRRVLVEIVGYWGREYLETKFARLRAARCGRLITCVSKRALGTGVFDLSGLDVIAFRDRVDVGGVIARACELLRS
jgi:predicted nuclease of restriction endonuclease-like RecB superfamily